MKRCGCTHDDSSGCLRMDHNARRVWVRCAECGKRQRNQRGAPVGTSCSCGSVYGTYDQ